MTTVRLLKNGAESFPALFSAIDNAVSCVAVEMYLIADDQTGRELRARLTNTASRGVDVKVIFDAFGSWALPDSFWDPLLAAGGQVRRFRPALRGMSLFRNHRKLVLVDDRIAVIGGMNISDHYFRGGEGDLPWRDNALLIDGVESARLRRSFNRMWLRAGRSFRSVLFRMPRVFRGRRLPLDKHVLFLESGPENLLHPVRKAYRQLIRGATGRIDLAMGYFYPHGRMVRALGRAVRRGVAVRLLLPQKSDVALARWAARGLYGKLLAMGVEVWEYLPTMMHAKTAIIDDRVITGSANLDIRSGRINYELVAMVYDPVLARRARFDFEADLVQSTRISLAEWKKRPLVQRIKERVSYCIVARLDIYFARAEMSRRRR